jgi:hypothetical protein
VDRLIKKIDGESTIHKELLSIANDDTEWVLYYNFMAKPVPNELLDKDPFFVWLRQRYNFMAGIVKMEPFQNYDWHQDTRRGLAINMLLEGANSIVFFTEDIKAVVKNVIPAQYYVNSYHLFNTQVPHCIINMEGMRYLFTVEFELDKEQLSYADLVKALEDYKPLQEQQ